MNHGKFHFGSASTGFEAELKTEMAKFKIAPAAGGYLLRYGVLPSQVVATGPRGHVLKGDVLKYVEDNKLQPRDLKSEPSATTQVV